jgi:hypothetical protein
VPTDRPVFGNPGRPTGRQKRDLGLASADIKAAMTSNVPFILLRYHDDGRCPPERVAAMRLRFTSRMASIELPGKHHSSLAGDFNPAAFDDVVIYLKVRFDPVSGPQPMTLARLHPGDAAPCLIGRDGMWHVS